MKTQVREYQKYKMYRVFGDKSKLPDHLQKTDLQLNNPFVMVSMMGYVFSPDLCDQYFDYSDHEADPQDHPTLLQLRKDDLEKYFVPCNVTTDYKGHVLEWRKLNDQMVYHGGRWEIAKRLKLDTMNASDRIVQETVLNAYHIIFHEIFGKK